MPAVQALGAQYGHIAVVHAIRSLLSEMRQAMLDGVALPVEALQEPSLARRLQARLEAAFQPSLRRVFNLFDLRCLENEREFIEQLAQLRLDASGSGS
mgnify:CR=1 FL=1